MKKTSQGIAGIHRIAETLQLQSSTLLDVSPKVLLGGRAEE